MRKILLVVTKGEVGGAQAVVRSLAFGLKQKGWDVSAGIGEKGWLNDELSALGIPVFSFRHLGRSKNPLKNLLFAREMRLLCEKEKFDILHIHSSNALFAALGAKYSNRKIRTSFTMHGLSFMDPNHRVSRFVRFFYIHIYRWLLQWVDIPICISERDYKIASELHLVREKYIVRNGVTPRFLEKEQARHELSKRAGKDLSHAFIIGTVGRFAYPKNFEFLIQAMVQISSVCPKAVLVLLGDGPEQKKYENNSLSFEITSHVCIIPGITNASAYLKAFDLFVLSSWYEGTPLTALEALHAGIPMLLPNTGGMPELLGDDERQIYKLLTREFIKKIIPLLKNRAQREELGSQNKKRAKQYTQEGMVEEYEKLFASHL